MLLGKSVRGRAPRQGERPGVEKGRIPMPGAQKEPDDEGYRLELSLNTQPHPAPKQGLPFLNHPWRAMLNKARMLLPKVRTGRGSECGRGMEGEEGWGREGRNIGSDKNG